MRVTHAVFTIAILAMSTAAVSIDDDDQPMSLSEGILMITLKIFSKVGPNKICQNYRMLLKTQNRA